ncbi:MAG TPA: DUF6298 domain-containing protein [Armatimonadota bacterium]
MRKTMSGYIVPMILSAVILIAWAGFASASITAPLTRYSANPHYFANNGQPVVIIGTGQIIPANTSVNYQSDIDAMAAHKSNYARIWAFNVWSATEEMFPFARDAGGTAVDGKPKYNLTHWDSTYWSRLKDACAYAQSKDMYVGIPIFDRCGIDKPTSSTDHRWDWNPWNPLNNVNGLTMSTTTGIPDFYNLSNAALLKLQEAYVSKLISETSQYPNVTYEICNEYTGGTWAWEQHWVDYVKARCSNLVSINHLGTPSSTPSSAWSYAGVDFVKNHVTNTSASTTASAVSAMYSWGKPIDIDETPETSGITATNYRNMLWPAFCGGGNIHLEDGANISGAQDSVMYVRSFLNTNSVQFWNMSPNNALVTATPGGTAYCLAKPGSQYVVYIVGSGSGSMTMTLTSGYTYTAKAYNPSNGTYTSLSVSGNTISGIPSYSSDIVIYVSASTSSTSTSPSVTVTLAADKTTTLPGSAITYTVTYKNAGTGPAQNLTISCLVPANTTYVAGSSSSSGSYNSTTKALSWTLSGVAAGTSGTMTFRVTVD